MGAGRVLNNHIKQYAQSITNLEDLPEGKERREILADKDPYFQRMYRTSNTTYPDVLYEKLPYPQRQPVYMVNFPIPPSNNTTATELAYAEPSNILTDNIMYEEGIPHIREDEKLTREVSRGPAGNTLVTTEYAPGLSEKIRKENPVVISTLPVPGPGNKTIKRIHRLRPIEKTHKRRFNTDYDDLGRPLQREKVVYDTVDYVKSLSLTNEDFREGEAGGILSYDVRDAFEDFITKGKVREGLEIIPSED